MTIVKQLEKIIAEVRPLLQMDGGDVEFISYDDKTQVVKVRLSGACQGCPFAGVTLSRSVLKKIQEKLPQITDVINV